MDPDPCPALESPSLNNLVMISFFKFLMSVCSILVVPFIFPASKEPPFPPKDFLHTLWNTVCWQVPTPTSQLSNSLAENSLSLPTTSSWSLGKTVIDCWDKMSAMHPRKSQRNPQGELAQGLRRLAALRVQFPTPIYGSTPQTKTPDFTPLVSTRTSTHMHTTHTQAHTQFKIKIYIQ